MSDGSTLDTDAQQRTGGVSRRRLLQGIALVGAGAASGGAVGGAIGHARHGTASATSAKESFYGPHQSGIITDSQRHTVLAAFDVVNGDKAALAAMLKSWTELSATLVNGESTTVPIMPLSSSSTNAYSDATNVSTTDDSFEAYQLGAQRLTVTVGFGRSLFVTAEGKDRFGLASRLPQALVELPRFSGDQLDATVSDGDLFVHACADDPQVAFHAVRSIARIAPDVATLRWTQLGFSPSNTGGTPRNLMGFKDGTVNSNGHPPTDPDTSVWVGSEGPEWMRGGSYVVYRRIRIALEHWDRLVHTDQEKVVGRTKLAGAPLSGGTEFSALELTSRDSAGSYLIPQDAHVRLAAPESNKGAIILRRAFSYNNGTTPFTERWPPWRQALEYDAGLLFLGYQKDPRTAFIPVNTNLALNDALNQFTTHTASAIFAIPPGATGLGDWIGRGLLT